MEDGSDPIKISGSTTRKKSSSAKPPVETRRNATAPASIVTESLQKITPAFHDVKNDKSSSHQSTKDQSSSAKVLDIANWDLDLDLEIGDDTDLNLLSSKEHTIVENESPPRMLTCMIPPQPRSSLPFGSAAPLVGGRGTVVVGQSETAQGEPRMPSSSAKAAWIDFKSVPPNQSTVRPPIITDRKTSFDIPSNQTSHTQLAPVRSSSVLSVLPSSFSAKSSIKSTTRPKSKLSMKRMFDTRRSSRSNTVKQPVNYYTEDFVDFSHGILQKLDIETLLKSEAREASEVLLIDNSLMEIPSFIGEFKQIKTIDLRFNCFNAISKLLSELENVEHVNLSQNSISHLDLVAPIKHLRELMLFRNRISDISVSTSKVPNLTVLDLSGNCLTEFPKELLKLGSLQSLDLSGNQLHEVLCEFQKMKSLKKLLLSDNNITNVTRNMFSIPKIEFLDLSNNEINSISGDLKDIRCSLNELNLAGNRLTDIPASLFRLSDLEILDLRKNPIQTISPSIGHLGKLKSILLSPCYLGSIMMPPLKICVLGTAAIMKFLVDVMNGVADPDHSFAFGSGLAKSATVSNYEQFTIKAVDRYGVAKNIGGDTFMVMIEILDEYARTSTLIIEPEDKDDGSYLVTYPANTTGKYKIIVQIDGADIKGSPFEIEYEPSCVCARHSKLVGANDGMKVEADTVVPYMLELYDEFSNRIRECPSFLVPAISFSSESIASNIIKGDDGSFLIEFSSAKMGKYTCEISLSGEPIESSPFIIEVTPGMVDPNSCIVSTSGTRTAEINHKTTFIIQSCDKFSNVRKNCKDQFNVIIDGPEGNIVPSEIVPNYLNGEHYVSYTPTIAGRYRITVMLLLDNGDEQALHNVAGSPIILDVSADSDDKFLKLQQENSNLVKALAEFSRRGDTLASIGAHSEKKSLLAQCGSEELIDILMYNVSSKRIFATPAIAMVLFEACSGRPAEEVSAIIVKFSRQLSAIKNSDDTELLYYILANFCAIKTFWITKTDQLTNADKEMNTLTVINELIESHYNQIVKNIQNWLSPVIVSAFLEHADPELEPTTQRNLKTLRHKHPVSRNKNSLENVLSYLRTVMNTLAKYCVEDGVSQNLIEEVLRFVDVILFNSLLLRKNLCNRETADKAIRNLKILDSWIRKNLPAILVHFDHLEAAIEILYAPDLNAIYGMLQPGTDSYISTYLNSHQVERILRNAYDPGLDETMMNKISKELTLTRKFSSKSQQSSLGKKSSSQEHAVQIFLDTFHVAPLVSNTSPNEPARTDIDLANPHFFYPPALRKQLQNLFNETV